MENEASDKQHQASAKRLDQLRKKGTVLRSRDLTSGLVFIVGVMVLLTLSAEFKLQMEENFILSFSGIKQILNEQGYLPELLARIVIGNFKLLLPIFCILLITVFLSPFLFGGWNFTFETVQFNLEKLNAITNIKNIFSPARAFVEILKSLLKTCFIFGVLIYFVIQNKNHIIDLLRYSPKVAVVSCYSIMVSFVVTLIFTIIVIMFLDALYHYFKFQNQIKMTTQELKDEFKDAEGSVEVKRKIRSTQMALLRQRLNQSVPKANVVVVNPTHYSVALRYDERRDRAPKVVAKGKGATAQQIRMIAVSHAVPIYEAPVLARAIYHTTKIGLEVHPDLYMSVAIVLSYVHQLKSYQMGVGQLPKYIDDLQIPKEFIFNE